MAKGSPRSFGPQLSKSENAIPSCQHQTRDSMVYTLQTWMLIFTTSIMVIVFGHLL